MRVVRDPAFLAASLAHLGVDLLNSQRAILLAFLSVPLGLTNAVIGLINSGYTISASLSQPLFGYFADRLGTRWVMALGLFWMAIMFGLALAFSGTVSLIFLILASFGSGAVHPAGILEATVRGKNVTIDRETTAASYFFLFGQIGLSLGPGLGGLLLDAWGPGGLYLLIGFVVLAGVNASFRTQLTEAGSLRRVRRARGGGTRRWIITVFILLTAFRSWAQMNFIAFLPKYYSDLGYPPKLYGPLSALLMGGSALGGVIGGWLGDRFPKRWIVVSSLLFSTPLMLLFMPFGSSAFAAPLVLSIGFFVGASHSILVVLAQDMLPGGMGMASGLILGFTFASGSLGTLISGAQADRFGFNSVFLTSAVLALVAAVFARALPLERKPDLA